MLVDIGSIRVFPFKDRSYQLSSWDLTDQVILCELVLFDVLHVLLIDISFCNQEIRRRRHAMTLPVHNREKNDLCKAKYSSTTQLITIQR
jgi:hypothetical protein